MDRLLQAEVHGSQDLSDGQQKKVNLKLKTTFIWYLVKFRGMSGKWKFFQEKLGKRNEEMWSQVSGGKKDNCGNLGKSNLQNYHFLYFPNGRSLFCLLQLCVGRSYHRKKNNRLGRSEKWKKFLEKSGKNNFGQKCETLLSEHVTYEFVAAYPWRVANPRWSLLPKAVGFGAFQHRLVFLFGVESHAIWAHRKMNILHSLILSFGSSDLEFCGVVWSGFLQYFVNPQCRACFFVKNREHASCRRVCHRAALDRRVEMLVVLSRIVTQHKILPRKPCAWEDKIEKRTVEQRKLWLTFQTYTNRNLHGIISEIANLSPWNCKIRENLQTSEICVHTRALLNSWNVLQECVRAPCQFSNELEITAFVSKCKGDLLLCQRQTKLCGSRVLSECWKRGDKKRRFWFPCEWQKLDKIPRCSCRLSIPEYKKGKTRAAFGNKFCGLVLSSPSLHSTENFTGVFYLSFCLVVVVSIENEPEPPGHLHAAPLLCQCGSFYEHCRHADNKLQLDELLALSFFITLFFRFDDEATHSAAGWQLCYTVSLEFVGELSVCPPPPPF